MFELGNKYSHVTGKRLNIIGSGKSEIYGWCLIGEDEKGNLIPLGNQEGSFTGWKKVDKP